MFYRQAVEDLKNGYKQARKKPLVIRGARQAKRGIRISSGKPLVEQLSLYTKTTKITKNTK